MPAFRHIGYGLFLLDVYNFRANPPFHFSPARLLRYDCHSFFKQTPHPGSVVTRSRSSVAFLQLGELQCAPMK